jgi:DNA primase
MTTDRWMTYAEAAQALGMTTESVRQRARREHWRKQLGNDGKAQILVPADTDRAPPGDTADEPPASRPVKRPEPDTAVLQARITEMEIRGAELRADLERERAERIQERDRAERLVNEVADLAKQLARVAEEAGSAQAEAAGLSAQLADAKADRDAWRQQAVRPWWRRLVG